MRGRRRGRRRPGPVLGTLGGRGRGAVGGEGPGLPASQRSILAAAIIDSANSPSPTGTTSGDAAACSHAHCQGLLGRGLRRDPTTQPGLGTVRLQSSVRELSAGFLLQLPALRTAQSRLPSRHYPPARMRCRPKLVVAQPSMPASLRKVPSCVWRKCSSLYSAYSHGEVHSRD